MKKILFLIGISLSCFIANGQTYNPFVYGQSQGSSQNQQNSNNGQEETYRTTAYHVDSYGQVYKMPIKVQLKRSYYGSSYSVIEYYDYSGYGGWTQLHIPTTVSKCYPSSINKNSLENQFMYKATIMTKTYYFDL